MSKRWITRKGNERTVRPIRAVPDWGKQRRMWEQQLPTEKARR